MWGLGHCGLHEIATALWLFFNLAGNVGIVSGVFSPQNNVVLATLHRVSFLDAVLVACWHDDLRTYFHMLAKNYYKYYHIMQQSNRWLWELAAA